MTKKRNPVLRFLLRLLAVLLGTALLLAAFLYGVMYLLCRGPSPTAKELFVLSTNETSAIGFLPRLYLSEAEIDEILNRRAGQETEDTDVSLISVPQQEPENKLLPDAWGFVDEDGDGLIYVPVAGESFVGHMLIVLDPLRVIVGCVPESFQIRGYTLEELVTHYDAVAGINGGDFEDPNGTGNGSTPEHAVVFKGQIYMGGYGTGHGFAGIDGGGILHVGSFSSDELREKNIRHGTSYGPVLVVNGEMADPASLHSGVNPRTAIGQRSDGAILMLVIVGRQPNSLGATYLDEAEIMLKFGAVNACNLDGGSSSLMWLDGGYVNAPATIVGIRRIPTSFLVLKEGVSLDD